MVVRVAHGKLRLLLLYLAWFGWLICLDLACGQVFGADYFRETKILGVLVAITLGMLPFAYARWRRERRRRATLHMALTRQHREQMAGPL